MQIAPADLDAADVQALLDEHLAQMRATSPACSVHALPLDALRAHHVRTWTARDDEGALLGIGALAELDPAHGELKSMRTARAHRGTGVGAAMLAHLLEEARSRGYARVSLETGTQDPFAPARRLYERFGFDPCPPFAGYAHDPHSAYYCRAMVAPEPRNRARMRWDEVPDQVVEAIEAAAGAAIVRVDAVATGFSPGFAGRVAFSSGPDLFVKLMSASRDPWSIDLARSERAVASTLPGAAARPALQWSRDDGEWLVLGFEAIDGRQPDLTGSTADRQAAFDALAALAQIDATGTELPTFADACGPVLRSWRRLAEAEHEDRERRLESLGSLRGWIERHLDTLVAWEEPAPAATAGDRLVHSDMRADNMLIGGDRVWFVDWPYASVGAPWLDLAGLVPAMSMNGAGPAHRLFHDHPLAAAASPEAERAVVTAFAGYFAVASTDAELPALPGLRAFQRAQALPAIDWLRTLAPELD